MWYCQCGADNEACLFVIMNAVVCYSIVRNVQSSALDDSCCVGATDSDLRAKGRLGECQWSYL